MCGEAALGSTRNGLHWSWRCTAHISLQEPNRHQSLAAISVRLFPGSFQHISEQWGFWSRTNPNRRYRTPLAGSLCPRTLHQPGLTFSELHPVVWGSSHPIPSLYISQKSGLHHKLKAHPNSCSFSLYPFQVAQNPSIKSLAFRRSILASSSVLRGPELTESSSNLYSSMCDDFTSNNVSAYYISDTSR